MALHDIGTTFAAAAGVSSSIPNTPQSKDETNYPARGYNVIDIIQNNPEVKPRPFLTLEHNLMHNASIHWN